MNRIIIGLLCLAMVVCVEAPGLSQDEQQEYSFGAFFMDEAFKEAHTRKLPEVDSRGHFDWRDLGAVTLAESQGGCGACWAFSLTGVMESAIFLEHGMLIDLSEQFIVTCGEGYSGWSGCCGAFASLYKFYVDHDPVPESYIPFRDGSTGCPPNYTSQECDLTQPGVQVRAVDGSLFFVDESDPAQVISLLEAHGPSWFAFNVHTDFLNYWRSSAGASPWTDGIYFNTQYSFEGNHAVLLTGYDTESEYWICKNSWGQNGGPFGDGSFKYAWNGHAVANLFEIGNYDIEGIPDTPVPPTNTPSPTPTPIPPGNNQCPGYLMTADSCVCDSSLGAQDDFDCGLGFDGGDVVFHLTGLQDQAVYLFKAEADYNADFAVASVCNGSTGDVLCVNFKDPHLDPVCSSITEHNTSGYATLQWTAEQSEYWIWIDSTGAAWGDYCLEVTTVRTPTPTPTATPSILYVPAEYSTIRSAILTAKDGDTVLVANGTFTGTSNKNLNFQGKEIIVKSQNGPENCIIDCRSSGRAAVFAGGENENTVFSGFTVKNGSSSSGSAVYIQDSSPVITNCIFQSNTTSGDGGAIFCSSADPHISDCIIRNNTAADDGGGVYLYDSSPAITNCLIQDNFATDLGGGVYCEQYSSPEIVNCTIYSNETDHEGGGISAMTNCSPQVTSCIFQYNQPQQIYLSGGSITVTYSDIEEGYPGIGNISSNPYFVSGPMGDFYLNLSLSPCFNAGSTPASNVCFKIAEGYGCLGMYTMRIDETPDTGLVDMGFHYKITIPPTYTPFPTFTPGPTNTPDPLTIWVPDDYATIREAVFAADPGDTVIVRDGIYTGSSNRNIDFLGKEITVKSENGPDHCIIDAEYAGIIFSFSFYETENAVVKGFTLMNGTASGTLGGGAMKIMFASPLITGCVFKSNFAAEGGGAVYVGASANPQFTHCQFEDNSTVSDLGGGAILIKSASSITTVRFVNCLFKDNSTTDYGGAVRILGGGIRPELMMENCTLTGNFAANGPEIYSSNAKIILTNCIVWNQLAFPPIKTVGSTEIISFSDISLLTGVYSGTENINQNPMFVTGYRGTLYLSPSSPCVDAGDENADGVCYLDDQYSIACLSDYTTQIDGELDHGAADMGYHYVPYIPVIYHVPSHYPTIQNAIDNASDFDIVMVAPGTYTGVGNKNLNFLGKRIKVQSGNGPFDCVINCEGAGRGVRFINGEDFYSVFDGFTIQNGGAVSQGGAIFCQYSSPLISNCIFSYNSATESGGAIYSEESGMTLTSTVFEHNSASDSGGAIYCLDSSDQIYNCLFERNWGANKGGAILCDSYSHAAIESCTFYANEVESDDGGAIASLDNSDVVVKNSVFYADQPTEIHVYSGCVTVTYSNVMEGWPGTGNMDANPRFVTGPLGDFYLDYSARNMSPCIDTGTGSASSVCYATGTGAMCMSDLTTRIDALTDSGIVDMGYHYECAYFGPTPTPTPYQSPTPVPAVLKVPSEYATIQQAINAASNADIVLVADGSYSGPGNINLDTLGKAITVLSENGPVSTIIDCQGNGRGFRIHSGEDNRTVIHGFTLQNGWIETGIWPEAGGGGILCVNSDPVVANCILKWNHAMYGGGVMIQDSQITLTNCLITSNTLLEQNNGGGIYCSDSKPDIINCTVVGNSAQGTFTGNGGGLYTAGSVVQISNSIIWDNVPDSIHNATGYLIATYSDIYQSAGLFPGTGNINADPLFVTGYQGYFYLNQSTKSLSPCVDTGAQTSDTVCFPGMGSQVCMDDLSTDVARQFDAGVVDMGFHYQGLTGPTATPDISTPTPTPTPTSVLGILQGFLALERPGETPPAQSFIVPVDIGICDGGDESLYSTVWTDSYGVFTVAMIPGVYTLRIKSPHSLAVVIENIEISTEYTAQSDIESVFEGDADNNNSVTSSDFFILRNTYNKSCGDTGYDDRADFNEDCMVTSTDFFQLRSHYNLSGGICPVSRTVLQ